MPSARARERYKNITDGIVSQQMVNAQSFQREQTALHLYDNAEKSLNEGVDQVYRYPTLENYTSQLKVMNDYLDANKDSLFTGDKAVEMQKKLSHDLTTNGLLRGYLEQDPATGLSLMGFHADGKPLTPDQIKAKGYQLSPQDITHNLDKHEVADWVNKFQAKLEEKRVVEVRQLNNQLADYKAAAASGDTNVTIDKAKAIVERMDSLNAFKDDPAMKVRVYADVLGDVMAGRSKVEMSKLSNDQISAIAAGSGNINYEARFNAEIAKMSREQGVNLYPQFAAADKQQMISKVQSAANALLHDRANDPARALLTSNDAIKKSFVTAQGGLSASPEQNEQYFAASLAEQKSVGISKAKLLTNDMSKGLAAQISSGSAQASSSTINDLKMKTGKYFPQVMSQIIKDGNLPDYYAVAGYIDDSAAGSAIIDGMRNKKTMDTVLADNAMGYKKSQLLDSVNSEFAEIDKAIKSQGGSAENVKISNGLRQAILYDTANRVAHGVDASEAAKQATDLIFRNKYEIHKGAVIPRDASPNIKTTMDYVSSKDWADKVVGNLHLPSVLDGSTGKTSLSNNSAIQALKKDFQAAVNTVMPDSASEGWSPQNNKAPAAPSPAPQGPDPVLQEKANRIYKALADKNGHVWSTTPDNSGATLNLIDKKGNPIPMLWKNGKKVQIDFASGMLREGD